MTRAMIAHSTSGSFLLGQSRDLYPILFLWVAYEQRAALIRRRRSARPLLPAQPLTETNL